MGSLIHQRKLKAFTLLEVLIALLILSVAGIAIIKAYNASLEQQHALEEHTLANWIADNTLNNIRASRVWQNYGTNNSTTNFANRPWNINVTTSPTPHAQVQKIVVTVSRPDTSTSLTGYVGKF